MEGSWSLTSEPGIESRHSAMGHDALTAVNDYSSTLFRKRENVVREDRSVAARRVMGGAREQQQNTNMGSSFGEERKAVIEQFCILMVFFSMNVHDQNHLQNNFMKLNFKRPFLSSEKLPRALGRLMTTHGKPCISSCQPAC